MTEIISNARRVSIALAALALSSIFLPEAVRGQRALDVQIGSWALAGSNPTIYSAGAGNRIWRSLSYNLRILAVIDSDSADGSLFGLAPELRVRRGTRKLQPYVTGGVGLAFQSGSSTEAVALWYAGLGAELSPSRAFGVALEASYLIEDAGFAGFWNLAEGDRRGWAASVRFALRWGGGGGTSGTTAAPTTPTSFPTPPPAPDGSTLSGRIVQTALAAMGEPYRWGGTSTDEGFDCSGLVWYAYMTHGVEVARVSGDQARAGRYVGPDVAMLEPGDILLFDVRGNGVSHVGLYVGNAQFIHATTSGGVRVSSLDASSDAYDGWWRERWVGARRVL